MISRLLGSIRRANVGVVDVARAGAALPVVVMVDVLLRVVGFGRTLRLVGSLVPLRDRTVWLDPRKDRGVADAVDALDRASRAYAPSRMCLRRALALWAYLRWRGVTSKVELGVRRTGTGVIGHAWVVWRGEPLHEPAGTVLEYGTFDSLPSPGGLR